MVLGRLVMKKERKQWLGEEVKRSIYLKIQYYIRYKKKNEKRDCKEYCRMKMDAQQRYERQRGEQTKDGEKLAGYIENKSIFEEYERSKKGGIRMSCSVKNERRELLKRRGYGTMEGIF